MSNPHLDKFMASFPFVGLTFDDVSLVTQYADFLPHESDITSRFSRNVPLNIPFVSAAMDTVTQSRMAIALALMGGIGVVHKNQDADKQAEEVLRVKHYLNGLIADPVVFRKGMKVSDVLAIKAKSNYQFSGFPIVDERDRLVGILTARDVKFLTSHDVLVEEVMTTELVVGKLGTTTAEALDVMRRHRVGKLPIVDERGRLAGLYSFQDVKSITENSDQGFNRDAKHQLRVAAAVGVDDAERVDAVVRAEVDAVVVDTAHGHSKGVIEEVRRIKRLYGVDVVAGNVATGEAALALVKAGADAIKVGIGPGSICTTRVVAGVAAGADCVMMGSVLAGTDDSPGERILHQGRTYVTYRGMGSMDAMKAAAGARERYSQGHITDPDELVPQGIEGLVPYRGRVTDVLHQYVGGLRFALGYCGTRTVRELQERGQFVRVTSAGLQEAHPHGVKVIKDAPNYPTR
ncbi:MAG: Inosine-5'-monophosphate dehydrogenase [Lentisphaerae bacterium ADurb.BinA184]|nr:MAG: Inosine-5'-monophosphate dehydrogenase [Lentisphaerae bacterium ADurb.BinA184]